MKCSVCSSEINDKYCSKCGQYYNGGRINFITFLGDLFGSIFSLEKSFFRNIRIGLSQPKTLVLNYWNGFRKFYYSPGKFFTMASLFILLHYIFAKDFLGVSITSKASTQFILLSFNIFILTFLSFITFFKYKRNLYEHLVLNIYNVSLWTIVFVPISITLNLLNTSNFIEQFFFIPYHLLIIIWNSRAFDMSKLKRITYVILNLILFYGIILLLIYKFGEF
ncbi:hypothetical protein EV201_0909 [Ancylomarina subtilis]|uniref:DUF3667 domain-containing protein n=1 Tax=Ancylomarina subtilis TaxID=1639035 RepID=A0A4Q7VJC8_9BACT|nr:hypothetical protein EV201_0909 [Ancylomarina subtilis]